jgi:starch synthase
MVDDGRTGLLVPIDDPEALAGAVARLYREAELAGRLARAARLECPKYSWAAAANRWKSLYIRLGTRREPAPA